MNKNAEFHLYTYVQNNENGGREWAQCSCGWCSPDVIGESAARQLWAAHWEKEFMPPDDTTTPDRGAWPDGVPVVCCLACGHAHPAKAWVWTPQDSQHAAVGICVGCHDAALHLRGQCEGRGCLCVDGNPSAAVTQNER